MQYGFNNNYINKNKENLMKIGSLRKVNTTQPEYIIKCIENNQLKEYVFNGTYITISSKLFCIETSSSNSNSKKSNSNNSNNLIADFYNKALTFKYSHVNILKEYISDNSNDNTNTIGVANGDIYKSMVCIHGNKLSTFDTDIDVDSTNTTNSNNTNSNVLIDLCEDDQMKISNSNSNGNNDNVVVGTGDGVNINNTNIIKHINTTNTHDPNPNPHLVDVDIDLNVNQGCSQMADKSRINTAKPHDTFTNAMDENENGAMGVDGGADGDGELNQSCLSNATDGTEGYGVDSEEDYDSDEYVDPTSRSRSRSKNAKKTSVSDRTNSNSNNTAVGSSGSSGRSSYSRISKSRAGELSQSQGGAC